MLSKANLLNALLEIVLENPDMDLIESGKRKELLAGLCGTVASLYEQVCIRLMIMNVGKICHIWSCIVCYPIWQTGRQCLIWLLRNIMLN